MNKKIHLITLLLLPLFSIAQSNFKSGYVVNLKGDTLRGYIDFREWARNPKNINFKSALSDGARQLGKNDIAYFEITGSVSFRQYRVNISLNPIDISSPASLRDTSSQTDNVFLKILQKGKYVTLYSYYDVVKNRFYIKDNSMDTPIELSYGVYENPGNSIGILEINTFRDQLNQLAVKYMSGLNVPADQIQSARYNESSLIPIVSKINGDDFTKMSVSLGSTQGKHSNVRFFAGVAYNESTFQYTPRGIPYPGSVPSNSGSPKLTLGLDAFANPNIGHLVFRLELAYKQQSSYHFQEANTPSNLSDDQINSQILKQTNVSIIPQVIYNLYNANSVKIFIDFGLALNISSYADQLTSVTPFGSSTTSGPDTNYNGTWFNIQFKSGVIVSKRIEIYGAYYTTATLIESVNNDYVGYSGVLSSYQVGSIITLAKAPVNVSGVGDDLVRLFNHC